MPIGIVVVPPLCVLPVNYAAIQHWSLTLEVTINVSLTDGFRGAHREVSPPLLFCKLCKPPFLRCWTMGYSNFSNFCLQVYLPKRGKWRAIKYLVLRDSKFRLAKELDYHYSVHECFFGTADWHETGDTEASSEQVENYPLFIGNESHRDEGYETCPDENRYEWMQARRGEWFAAPVRTTVPPTWDEFLTRVRERLQRRHNGDPLLLSNAEFFNRLDYGSILEDHYQCLVAFVQEMTMLRLAPLSVLSQKVPDADLIQQSAESSSSLVEVQAELERRRKRVYLRCLKVLLGRQLGDNVVALVADLAGPTLPQFRLHFDECSDV